MNWADILISWAYGLGLIVLFFGALIVRIERAHRRRMAAIDAAEAADRDRTSPATRAWDEQVARWDTERAATETRLKALIAEVDAQFDRLEAALGAGPAPAAAAATPGGEPHPEAGP